LSTSQAAQFRRLFAPRTRDTYYNNSGSNLIRLGKLRGNGRELWLNLQAQYDLARLRKAKRAEIAAIPTLAAE
jgi:hypothetical protein